MQLEFADDDLRRLYQEPDFHMPAFGPDLTKAYRKVVGFVAAARDERDLRPMRSLRLEQLKGTRSGQHSMRLNDQWRLIVRFVQRENGRFTVVIEVTDYH